MPKNLNSIVLDRKIRIDFPTIITSPVLASHDPCALSELALYTLDDLASRFIQKGARRRFSIGMLDRSIRFSFTMEDFYTREIVTKIIQPVGVSMHIQTMDGMKPECMLANKIRYTDKMIIRNMDKDNMGGLDG